MRLVENHRPHIRQNARIGRIFRLLLYAQIGEEQMMIDDDQVALGGLLMHLGDEAALELPTLLAGA